jgi:hypothetical protein
VLLSNPFRSVVPSSVLHTVVTTWGDARVDSDQKSTFTFCATWCRNTRSRVSQTSRAPLTVTSDRAGFCFTLQAHSERLDFFDGLGSFSSHIMIGEISQPPRFVAYRTGIAAL